MTREEAIDCNKNLRMYMRFSDKNQPCKFLEENYIALDMAIKALEQDPKWIPVSEELPNKEGYYLLRHIEEILEKIDSETVISDYEKYPDIIEKNIKKYVTSRDLFIEKIENENKINQGEDR